MYLVTKWFGTFLCDKKGIKKEVLFPKDEKELVKKLRKIEKNNILPEEKKIAKDCDHIVERLAQSNLSVNQAVCFTLVARHFKRIMAHLVNIATSVVLPLSDLDYFDERSYEN